MKKWMLLSLTILAVGFVAAGPVIAQDDLESPLFTPAPEPKIVCDKCLGIYTTSPGGGAASAWGFGATCAAAQADVTNQLWLQADNGCVSRGLDGACSLTVVVTGACWWNSSHGSYQVDAYANYKCSVYIC